MDIGIACASTGRRQLSPPIVVGSRQTIAPMVRRGREARFDIVILDEAHLCHPNDEKSQYHQVLQHCREINPGLRVLGVTATPYRLSGGKIYGEGKLFSRVDFKITAEELLAGGYIVPLEWKVRQSDLLAQLDAVHKTSTGELNEKEQGQVLGQKRFVQGIYDVFEQYARNRRVAVFALNISHAEQVAEVFAGQGVRTYLIHSKLSTQEVNGRIAGFLRDPQSVIINVGILTLGSDLPPISAIILARRTLSTALLFQIVGRGARLHPGKSDCLVLDPCGNALIHGCDPDNPIIQGVVDDSEKDPRIKICPMCEAAVSISCRVCKCGFEFPTARAEAAEPEPETEAPGKLVDFKGYQTEPCNHVQYKTIRTGRGVQLVMVLHYLNGSFIARQMLCPGWQHGKSQRDKAVQYWFELGGKRPAPINVDEWMRRISELRGTMEVILDRSVKPPLVKYVRAA